jgi:hypothetical protein
VSITEERYKSQFYGYTISSRGDDLISKFVTRSGTEITVVTPDWFRTIKSIELSQPLTRSDCYELGQWLKHHHSPKEENA